jgi:hypothetical protein
MYLIKLSVNLLGFMFCSAIFVWLIITGEKQENMLRLMLASIFSLLIGIFITLLMITK